MKNITVSIKKLIINENSYEKTYTFICKVFKKALFIIFKFEKIRINYTKFKITTTTLKLYYGRQAAAHKQKYSTGRCQKCTMGHLCTKSHFYTNAL